MDKIQFNFHLPKELYEAIRYMAFRKHMSMTAIIIEALQAYMRESK